MASVKITILGSASHQTLLPFKLIGLRAGGGRVLLILTMLVGVVSEEIPN
jgi:Na+/citrate or Na+/malate symporter